MSNPTPMSAAPTEAGPWLGTCQFARTDEAVETNIDGSAARDRLEGLAAVYCMDQADYATQARAYGAAQGLRLIWSEEVHPAGQWIARYPMHRDLGGSLARAVNPGIRVTLGPLTAISNTDTSVAVPDQNYLIIEEIKNVEPLDAQMGVHPRKTVPDALCEPLFGQPEPTKAEIIQYGTVEAVPPMRTYAVLDAAKMPYLLTGMLESSGLNVQSLFQGPTQEDLKEHAPYLVELTKESNVTEKLFTGPKGVNGLWEKELGIYIRSRATFDQMRKHFRKFTRMQDEKGKWYYFRFWEPSMAVTTARLISDNPIFWDKVPPYYKFLQFITIFSVTGGGCFTMRSTYETQETNLKLDVQFFGFVYAITKIGMNEDKDIDFESIYRDLPRLWIAGIRDSETVEDYAKIKKSNGLMLITNKIVASELIRRPSKVKAIKYLSRFA